MRFGGVPWLCSTSAMDLTGKRSPFLFVFWPLLKGDESLIFFWWERFLDDLFHLGDYCFMGMRE